MPREGFHNLPINIKHCYVQRSKWVWTSETAHLSLRISLNSLQRATLHEFRGYTGINEAHYIWHRPYIIRILPAFIIRISIATKFRHAHFPHNSSSFIRLTVFNHIIRNSDVGVRSLSYINSTSFRVFSRIIDVLERISIDDCICDVYKTDASAMRTGIYILECILAYINHSIRRFKILHINHRTRLDIHKFVTPYSQCFAENAR